MRRIALLLLAATAALGAAAGAVRAADPFEDGPTVQALTPPCDDPRVLGQVEDQFEYGAPRVLEQPLTVVEFSQLREKAWFPKEPASFERRYCEGRVLLSNNDRATVYYRIGYPQGYAAADLRRSIAGVTGFKINSLATAWKAEGCVVGYDRWHVYGANCQSLRRY